MIVAVVMTAFLGTAIFSTFSQGLRLWARSAKDRGEWKVELFMERLTHELQNNFADPKWRFRGTTDAFDFSTVEAEDVSVPEEGLGRGILYMRYLFNSKRGTMEFQRYGFREVFSPQPRPKNFVTALDKIKSFELEYYAYDPKAAEYRWRSKWNQDCPPPAVRISMQHEGAGQRKISRMIHIPVGGVCSA